MRDVSRGTNDVQSQIERMVRACSTLGLELRSDDIEEFSRYLQELLIWNRRINLVSRKDTDNIALHHFVDALSLLLHLDLLPAARVMDIGSGAGFPGIPLKICRRDLVLTLVESKRKKALFLKHVIDVLQVKDVVVYQDRAENLNRQVLHQGSYDIVVARAISNLRTLVHLSLPFLIPGGVFVAYKGGSAEEELAETIPELTSLGGEVERQVKVHLPIANKERQLIIIKKVM